MKKKMILLIFGTIFFLSLNVSAQEFVEEKNSISGSVLGTSALVGITYERIFNHNIMAELGLGLFGYGVGVTYFPKGYKMNTLNFYTGVKYNDNSLGYDVVGDDLFKRKAYIPIGVNYPIEWNKFYFSGDIGPAFVGRGIFGNLKFAFRF